VAIMPWNPLMWYALSRLRLAVEIDCDRRVLLQRHTAPATYGELLLELSTHRSSFAAPLPVLAYNTSHLERRLIAMTQRPARHVLARRTSGAAIALVAIVAACESRLPTAAEIEAPVKEVKIAEGHLLVSDSSVDSAQQTLFVDSLVFVEKPKEKLGKLLLSVDESASNIGESKKRIAEVARVIEQLQKLSGSVKQQNEAASYDSMITTYNLMLRKMKEIPPAPPLPELPPPPPPVRSHR
jgi:hypothetical protein